MFNLEVIFKKKTMYKRAWTNNAVLTDNAKKSLLVYLEDNKEHFVEIGNFVFDKLSLNKKIVLSKCLQCEKYQRKNCCQGRSYPMSEENQENLLAILNGVMGVMPNKDELVKVVEKYGVVTRGGATTTRGTKDGICFFNIVDNGHELCAIHKYCIEHNLNPIKYKPYPCSLFPIEGIVMPNGKTFVFGSCDETGSFSMFFYTLYRRICVNTRNLLKIDSGLTHSKYANDVNLCEIKKDKLANFYKPMWEEQENVLRWFVGNDVYDTLKLKMKENF